MTAHAGLRWGCGLGLLLSVLLVVRRDPAQALHTAQPVFPGPTLTVDTSSVTHPISPLIYGINGWGMKPELAAELPMTVDRWGGDAATRYNYQLDVTNAAADWYFETDANQNTAYPEVSSFNAQIMRDRRFHAMSIATVPLIGWTTKREQACGFSVARYGAQKEVDPHRPDCGKGVLLNGKEITRNDPNDTSLPIDEHFVAGWVQYLVKKFGPSAAGGVALYELDNEPEFWSAVHRDVHPAFVTYDELTSRGLVYARAIKRADPTAKVGGPSIAGWQQYFYSDADLHSGWSTGPCYCYNGNPKDRKAHGNVPILAYYLRQFAKAEAQGGKRLLDDLDLHMYFAAKGAGLAPEGDAAMQAARLNSTRVLWDPTYTNPAYTDPEIAAKAAPPIAPALIPRMKALIKANYPGTKLAITEYNWGGLESVNGAIAQAELLGIFGREGVDLATLWGAPDPVTQRPGVAAFNLFLNYDGAGGKFGDESLRAASTDQGRIAVYAAKRSKDGAVTVLVLNKSVQDLTSGLTLATRATRTQVYRFSSANPAQILRLADAAMEQPPRGSAATVHMTFPAQSATLLVLAK
jgi:hypothetical protein